MGALDAHLFPWTGSALRHLAANAPYDVTDFSYAGKSRENRWNTLGEPTVYLAGDAGVVVAEWGRHLIDERSMAIARRTAQRTVYRLHLSLNNVLDIRQPAVWRHLPIANPPFCFTDIAITRQAAHLVRQPTNAQAILVPSVAFLDDLTRWNLVVFLDKLPADPHAWIQRVEAVGPLRWGD